MTLWASIDIMVVMMLFNTNEFIINRYKFKGGDSIGMVKLERC